MASSNNKKPIPAPPADAPANHPKPPTQMQLILAAQAKKKAEKEAKAKTRAAENPQSFGNQRFGNTSAGPQGNTHAKGGASGVARRTAPGG